MSHELLNRQKIYSGRVFGVSIGRFQSKTRGPVEIEIVHHNGGAGALPVFEDGTIALVRQWRYPLGRYSLEICAGRIETGHSPEETARRELEEEMGLRAQQFQQLAEFYVAPGWCEEKIYVYLARGLQPSSQNLDDDEEIEIVRLSFDEALALVRSGDINDAKSIITLTLAAPLLRAR